VPAELGLAALMDSEPLANAIRGLIAAWLARAAKAARPVR
jgi:hypothetical protein